MEKENKRGCCELCYTTYNDHGYPASQNLDACTNPNCQCHQQKPEQIEKEV